MSLMLPSKPRWYAVAALTFILAGCLAFSWNTRDAMSHLHFRGHHDSPLETANTNRQTTIVDLSPWQTAETLTALATSAEEIELAHAAEHLADHEVDQAFAAALREATLQSEKLSGDALRLSEKVARLQQTVNDDQARVKALTATSGANASADDLEIAKAQLELETDQLNETQQDLVRAGGDKRGSIQQELAAHEAAMKKYDAQVNQPAPPAVKAAQIHTTVAALIGSWFAQRDRYDLLQTAARQSREDANTLSTEHQKLESSTAAPAPAGSRDTATRLARMSRESTRTQLLGIYDDRIEAEQQLAAVYDKWAAQVLLEHRMTWHLLLQSFALIAFILICTIVLSALSAHLAHRPSLDQRRMQTLSNIIRLAIQCVGAILILLVIFGVPTQMPTILGLATAGLTVVLQDFIIAFFGWFVLMGRNGIRIGDWVEINGVPGEIVNIGLFRTSMLETGNAGDKGHPTGRRTTFINSFAIKGQYFNFSTTGQWMWDEIRVAIPPNRDAYETIELVRKQVLEETAKDTREAEEEWKRVTGRHGLTRFTADPAVDMRPGSSGIDLIVRYVTRAADRFEVRNRLYGKVLGLLHKPAAA